MRLFVAVLLPDDVRHRLGAEVARLRRVAPEVNWVAPPRLHVTLKFLGQVEETHRAALTAALRPAAAAAAAFTLTVAGLGAFPEPARPRVVWAGVVEGADRLAALAAGVEDVLAPLGFPRETRPFAAHVTLGRVREARSGRALAAALAAAATAPFGPVPVRSVALMRSDLVPGGARYTEVAALPLGHGA